MTDRILQFIDYKGISKTAFYKEVGLSNGYLDKPKSIGGDKLVSILKKFPELDIMWLLTGEGQMLKPSVNITQNGNNNVNNGHNISGNKNKIESNVTGVDGELLEIIRKKDEQIERLLNLLEKK